MKKKRQVLKKAAAFFAAAFMLLGTSVTSFAAQTTEGITVPNDTKGSLTIHKYKMADTNNAGESNTASGGKEAEVTGAEPLGGVSFRITKVNEDGSVDTSWTAQIVETSKETGEAFLSELPLGRYKVEELGMLNGDGSDQVIPNTEDEAMKDGGDKDNGAITSKAFYVDVPMTTAEGNELNYNVHVYPKNEVLSIDKDVTFVGNKDDAFDMQEKQTWIINSTIPGNIAVEDANGKLVAAEKYAITDKIDSKLTYVEDSVKVTVVDKNYALLDNTLTPGIHYTVNYENSVLSVELTKAGKLLLKNAINNETNPAAFLQVRFETFINETAKPGEAIYNGASLDFGNIYGDTAHVEVPDGKNPDGTENPNEKDERPEVHTGAVSIKKVEKGNENKVLEGVEFMIFSDKVKAEAAVNALQSNRLPDAVDGALEVWDGTKYTKVVKTSGDGIAKFIGLAYYTQKPTGNPGSDTVIQKGEDEKGGKKTYYIVETKTHSGYQLPDKYYPVEISQTTSLSADPSYVITNTTQSILPKTGGAGTIMFTAIGLGIMAIAGIFLLMSKKDNSKDKA